MAIEKLIEMNSNDIYNLGCTKWYSKASAAKRYIEKYYPCYDNFTTEEREIFPDKIPRSANLAMDNSKIRTLRIIEESELSDIFSGKDFS